jgi:hypothetical protein
MSAESGQGKFPVREFQKILHACRADEPLEPGDPRHFDFTRLRGGRSVLLLMTDTLDQETGEKEHHHQILCGHRGTGKTTELKSLQDWADRHGFLCVWMDVYEYFGPVDDLKYTDLYLIIAEAVVTAMQEAGLSLPDAPLAEVRKWFAETVLEDRETSKSQLSAEAGVELKGEIPLLAKIFASFKAKREDGSEHLQTVRRKIEPRADDLVKHTNALLRTARQALQDVRPRGMLLFFDSLDRFPEPTIKALLQRSIMLRYLDCHAVYTMHINLMYKPDGTYWDLYNSIPVTLPTPALRAHDALWNRTVADSLYDEAAVTEMLGALEKRIVVDALFENPDDARLLVRMSGGSMRELLHLVNAARQRSRTSAEDAPAWITSAGVRAGIADYRLNLTQGLQPEACARLAALARDPQARSVIDDIVMYFFGLRLVMRYEVEGRGWNDIHPLVIECEGFQRACDTNAAIRPI